MRDHGYRLHAGHGRNGALVGSFHSNIPKPFVIHSISKTTMRSAPGSLQSDHRHVHDLHRARRIFIVSRFRIVLAMLPIFIVRRPSHSYDRQNRILLYGLADFSVGIS